MKLLINGFTNFNIYDDKSPPVNKRVRTGTFSGSLRLEKQHIYHINNRLIHTLTYTYINAYLLTSTYLAVKRVFVVLIERTEVTKVNKTQSVLATNGH